MSNASPSFPSICIPRVFANIAKRDVKEVFEQVLGVRGCVERVDLISKTTEDGTPYGRAFVHFRFWPKTDQATSIRDRILSGGTVKIVYDEPWFWKCSQSRVAKPEFTRERPAPYVEMEPAVPQPDAAVTPPAESSVEAVSGLPYCSAPQRQAHGQEEEPLWQDEQLRSGLWRARGWRRGNSVTILGDTWGMVLSGGV